MTLVTVVGNVNADIVARPLLELPPPGGDLLVDTIEVRVGGSAANAGMALARLGLVPRVIGAVGDDYLGRFVMDWLRNIGLDRDVRVPDGVEVIRLPDMPAPLRPILEAIPLQLLADHLARARGLAPGVFRHHQDDTKVKP